jgi:hypothetical protein
VKLVGPSSVVVVGEPDDEPEDAPDPLDDPPGELDEPGVPGVPGAPNDSEGDASPMWPVQPHVAATATAAPRTAWTMRGRRAFPMNVMHLSGMVAVREA